MSKKSPLDVLREANISIGFTVIRTYRFDKEAWRRFIYKWAEVLSQILGERVLVNEKVLNQELQKWDKEGLPYCVCRFERSPREVCPCIYHLDELRQMGRCKCGLFWLESKCNEFRKKVKKDVSFCV